MQVILGNNLFFILKAGNVQRQAPWEEEIHHFDGCVEGLVVELKALLDLDEPVDQDGPHALVDLGLVSHVVGDSEHGLEMDIFYPIYQSIALIPALGS